MIECPEWMAEGFVLSLRRRWPLVVRLHSSARQLFPMTRQGREWRGLDGRLSAWLEETSARRANVVVSTRSNLDEIAVWLDLDPDAVRSIPVPVRLPPAAPMPDPHRPRVTCIGRLEPRKAPEVVLRAAPKVLARIPNARFAFVGRDAIAPGTISSREWLQREAERLGVEHAIELTGQLDHAGVAEQLQRATVCAFPSRWESFGNVVAEASATGRPVVTSPIAPFRELVEDGVTGRLVAPTTPTVGSGACRGALRSAASSEDGQGRSRKIAGISQPERVADLAVAAYQDARERSRLGLRAGKRVGLRSSARP